MTRENMVERIKKLLALGKSSNENEAAAAMQKASNLMKEHLISVTDIEVLEAKEGQVVCVDYEVPDLRMKYRWVESLIEAGAVLCDCVMLVHSGKLHGTTASIVGFQNDIDAAIVVFEHLWKSWPGIVKVDLLAAKAEALPVRFAPKDTMAYKQGHGTAFANAIRYRCLKIAQARKTEIKEASVTGSALIVVKEDKVGDWMAENSVKSNRRPASIGSGEGLIAGRVAGEAIPLNAIKEQKQELLA